jgi:transmembrane sensor
MWAATAAGIAIAAFVVRDTRPTDFRALPDAPVSTTIIAPSHRLLPDGSTVELKRDAQLTVDFSPALRRVVLQAGVAHFDVHKDPARPFVVVAGGVEVRAVGTAFSVDRAAREVVVLVTEGRVAVTPPRADGTASATRDGGTIEAGQQATVPLTSEAGPPSVEIVTLTADQKSDRLAWRIARLEFSATPLADAIPMFNRYAGTRLELDPGLGGFRLSGGLRADDLEALLHLLQGEFGISAETKNNGVTILRRR